MGIWRFAKSLIARCHENLRRRTTFDRRFSAGSMPAAHPGHPGGHNIAGELAAECLLQAATALINQLAPKPPP